MCYVIKKKHTYEEIKCMYKYNQNTHKIIYNFVFNFVNNRLSKTRF